MIGYWVAKTTHKHTWEFAGDRGCPQDAMVNECSQPAYECSICGDMDYGEPGGPGWMECQNHKAYASCPADREPEFQVCRKCEGKVDEADGWRSCPECGGELVAAWENISPPPR